MLRPTLSSVLLVALAACDGGFTTRITSASASRLDGGVGSIALSVRCETHGLDHCLNTTRVDFFSVATETELADGGCAPRADGGVRCLVDRVDRSVANLRDGQTEQFELHSTLALPPGLAEASITTSQFLGDEGSTEAELSLP